MLLGEKTREFDVSGLLGKVFATIDRNGGEL